MASCQVEFKKIWIVNHDVNHTVNLLTAYICNVNLVWL